MLGIPCRYSTRAVGYMQDQWMRRVSLLVRTVDAVIEKAKDISIAANNQH